MIFNIRCYWCDTEDKVRMWWGRPLCLKCKAGEAALYESAS